MTAPTRTLSRTVTIVNAFGLHARSAARIAAIAERAAGPVWIESSGERVDAASVIDILTLGCPQGAIVTVTVGEAGDKNTLEAIVDLIQSGFGESL